MRCRTKGTAVLGVSQLGSVQSRWLWLRSVKRPAGKLAGAWLHGPGAFGRVENCVFTRYANVLARTNAMLTKAIVTIHLQNDQIFMQARAPPSLFPLALVGDCLDRKMMPAV
jgi:hypothetical protein